MFDLKDLTAEHFQALLDTALPIAGSDESLVVESVDLIRSPSPRGQPFSVTLRAPPGKSGPQGVYRIVHPDLGTLELFLVPLELKNGSIRFEAVFN